MNVEHLKRDLIAAMNLAAQIGAYDEYEQQIGERVVLDILKHHGLDAGTPEPYRMEDGSMAATKLLRFVLRMESQWKRDEREHEPRTPFHGKPNEPITFKPQDSPKV